MKKYQPSNLLSEPLKKILLFNTYILSADNSEYAKKTKKVDRFVTLRSLWKLYARAQTA